MDEHVEPFPDNQALAWLLARPGGRIETTVSDLARRWGWNRARGASTLETLDSRRPYYPHARAGRSFGDHRNELHCSPRDVGEQYRANPCDKQVTNSSSKRACSLGPTG